MGRSWSEQLSDLDLWIVLKGRGQIRAGDETFELRPGVAVMFRPGLVYEATQDPADRLCIDGLHFNLLDAQGDRLADAALPAIRLDVPDTAAAEAVSRRVRDRFHARASHEDWAHDAVAAALLRGLLLDLVDTTTQRQADTGGTDSHHRALVTRAQTRIREDPADPPTVAELAAEASYTPDHFARVFQRVTGRSPQTAIIAARLERARHLLSVTPMTVSQVAEALGYSDVFFFSRQFKRHTGQSPRAYRQQPRDVREVADSVGLADPANRRPDLH